jgi:hypothetical protein
MQAKCRCGRIFWVFCRNWFLMSPLHYLPSRSDFDFEFAEIFVIEKRLPASPSQGVDKIFNFLNKSIVIVYYITGFFFVKLVLKRAGLAV